jgi:hypothetical protein
VRNHCVKILSQRLHYCYVDKLSKSIIICEQWNTLFIKRLNNLTWPYFYKKSGSPVSNVIVAKKFRMKG